MLWTPHLSLLKIPDPESPIDTTLLEMNFNKDGFVV